MLSIGTPQALGILPPYLFILSLNSAGTELEPCITKATSTLSATFFTLKAEVELAKTLPESEISRSEMDLKMELISKTVLSNAEKLGKMESAVEKIEERVYELK